jgi:DNA-binding MarR family transcriptional regulator
MQITALDVNLEDRDQLIVAFPRILILAGEVTEKAGNKVIFGEFDLDVSRFGILATLFRANGQLSMKQLKDSNYLMRSSSNFTQMVDNLEQRGLTRRSPSREDRRVILVEITDEGRGLLDRVIVRYREAVMEYLDTFANEELKQALDIVIKWIRQVSDAAGISNLIPSAEPFNSN